MVFDYEFYKNRFSTSYYKLFNFRLLVKSYKIVSFLVSLVFAVGLPLDKIYGELERAVLKEELLSVEPYLLCEEPRGDPNKFNWVVWMVALVGI